MVNDLTTLAGALVECKDQLITELANQGVTATFDSTTGLLGLIHHIADIQSGGATLDTDITLTAPSSSVSIGDDVLLTANIVGSYDDTSSANIDLNNGVISNAPVIFKEGNMVLGTDYSDNNGEATYLVEDITSGTHTYTASFDGSNTHYNSSVSNTLTITPFAYIINDSLTSDNNLFYNYNNYGTATYSNEGLQVKSSGSGSHFSYILNQSLPSEYELEVTFVRGSTDYTVDLYCDGVYAEYNVQSNSLELSKNSTYAPGGSFNDKQYFNVTISGNNVFKYVKSGNNVSMYLDGTLLHTYDVTGYPSAFGVKTCCGRYSVIKDLKLKEL